jgi:hypothetical protein
MSDLDDAISEVNAGTIPANTPPLEQAIHEVHADAGQPSPVAEPSLWNKYLGFQESQLAGATGGLGSLAGGLTYAGALMKGDSPETAENARQQVSSALTYSPRTAEGKRQAGEMGQAADYYMGGAGGRAVGEKVADVTGSPSLGAAANTLVNVPQFLAGGKVAKDVPTAKPVEVPLTDQAATLKRAQDLGLVVPPATTNPTLLNRGIEGVAGKISVGQAASIKNQPRINDLGRQELGLPEDADLTPATLDKYRSSQSPAYQAIAAVPEIKFGPEYNKELNGLTKASDKITGDLPNYRSTGAEKVQALVDSIKPPSGAMSGETAVELSKSLRSEATAYDNSANRSGDPHDRALARAYRGSATAVENAIQSHLESIGQPELAANWDTARRNIAKSYSIESSLDGAGNIDASKLGKQSIKGKPLSGNLEAIADFANAFPKAAKVGASKESMPGISPLDLFAGTTAALGIGTTGHGVGPSLATGLAWPAGRMSARALATSKLGQKLAVPSGPKAPVLGPAVGKAAIVGSVNSDDEGRSQ